MGTPTLIVISGPGGSGKTTLAHRLAPVIGCPAVCRDEIKEGMVASHPGFVPAVSDPLTMRTYDLFFEVIRLYLSAEVTVIAEAGFQHPRWAQGLLPLAELADITIVRCQVPDEVARRRAAARLQVQPSRAAHTDAQHFSVARLFDHLHLDVPTIDVDTSDGYRPDLEQIATFARCR